MDEGSSVTEVRQPINVDSLQVFLEKNTENGAQRFGGGRLELKQFNNGASNPTYFVQTPAGEKFVLRKKPPGKLLPGAHQVDREYRVQKALVGTGVPVPEVLALCTDPKVLGQDFYIMKYVPGRIFHDVVKGGARLESLTPEDRDALYKDMARVLALMHSLDYKKLGLETFGKAGDYASRQIKTWTRNFRAQDEIVAKAAKEDGYPWKPERMEELHERLSKLAANIVEPTSIVHGDYRLGNVIVDPEKPKIVAVLDWELSTIGHPLADLAWLCKPWNLSWSGLANDDGTMPQGVPSQDEFVQLYATNRGMKVSPSEWDFFRALDCYRSAGIHHGVYARAAMGIAASTTSRGAITFLQPLVDVGLGFVGAPGAGIASRL